MAERANPILLIRPQADGSYQWYLLAEGRSGAGSLEDLARVPPPQARLILVVPAEQMSLHQVAFEPAERKLLSQTVPFSLEDELSGNIDELHFALGAVGANEVSVAVIDRELLAGYLDTLLAQGLEIHQALPEQLLLPLSESHWTLLVGSEDSQVADARWLVRYGACQGFALESASIKMALQLLLDETTQLPESLQLFISAPLLPALRDQQPEYLPELLARHAEWQTQDYWSTLAAGWRQGVQLDLLQGAFARRLPWQKWWHQWRWAAMVAGLAIGLQLSFGLLSVQDLKAQNLALRQEVEKAYRQAIPAGNLVDAEAQLRRQVAALQGSGGEGFMSAFAKTAQVIAKSQGVELEALNYSDNQREIRMTLLAPSFNLIESLRAEIEQQGLQAELTGSSNEAGKTRARLKINAPS